mmetsp:Transcript_8889/g.16712  ORF Transcript_8889/g.16712 Transcript_8889/m.16712 type:complete len:604 (+) Transcript_8889:191-2002(+)
MSSGLPRLKRRNSRELKAFFKDRSDWLGWIGFGAKLILGLICIYMTRVNVLVVNKARKDRAKEFDNVEQLREAVKVQTSRLDSWFNETVKVDVSHGGKAPGLHDSLNLADTVDKFEKVERTFRPPDNLVVVILGVDFIMKRDFPIWEETFTKANEQVIKTSKKKMAKGDHANWKVLKCLDLFDGKSHCIEPKQLLQLKRYQRVSRLYGLRKVLWNKDRFCETMNNALAGFQVDIEFVFPCWFLPNDFKDLIQKAKTVFKNRSFILKPTDRGEGNGIVVMDEWRQLVNWKAKFPDLDEVVVQTYLPNPFLINYRKWDMRTYVLVTSVNPLRAYMFRDGLVRFASSKYDKNAKGGGKATSFLTNTSVNKKENSNVDDLTWPFPKVYRWLMKNGYNPDLLWERIEQAVAKLLLSAEPSFSGLFEKLESGYTCANCYQLLGVDVIVDDDIVPRVIEVNGEPSMQLTGEVDSHYDYTKKSMTHDLVQLVYAKNDAASSLGADFMELELEGYTIGYERTGCKGTHDFCLSNRDVEYFLEMKKEQENMGGFRRIYPTKDGERYSKFIQHLQAKFPKTSSTGTYRIHQLATLLAKQSKRVFNNSINDPHYT